jgi:hypothetical protein
MRYLLDQLRADGYPVDKCILMEYKAELTPDIKEKRMQHARMKAAIFNGPIAPGLSLKLGYCVVWVDQKCLYIKPDRNLKLWGLSDPEQRKQFGGSEKYELIASHKLRQVCAVWYWLQMHTP